MPPRIKRPCRHKGCVALTNDSSGYCDEHRQQHAGEGWRNYQTGKSRQDQKSRYESYALGRQWGWLSVNDIRRMENMAPVEGGDKYLTPLNMVDTSTVHGLDKATPAQISEISAILQRTA